MLRACCAATDGLGNACCCGVVLAEDGLSGVMGESVVLAVLGWGEGVMGESVVGDVTESEEMFRESEDWRSGWGGWGWECGWCECGWCGC